MWEVIKRTWKCWGPAESPGVGIQQEIGTSRSRSRDTGLGVLQIIVKIVKDRMGAKIRGQKTTDIEKYLP